jgi:NADH-quinone oxidoreductase subunit L
MPWTCTTFVIGALSLAGIWPLSGFWSKDEILAAAQEHQPVLFYLALITVFMTAFYIFRVVFLTFGGEYRGGSPEAQHGAPVHTKFWRGKKIEEIREEHGHAGPHESPPVMTMPLVVLSILAIVSGWWNVTGDFSALLGHGETHGFFEEFFGILTHPLPFLALVIAGLGIFLAYAMYSAKWVSAEKVGATFKPLYTLFYRKYFFDELYENVIVKTVLLKCLFGIFQVIDSSGIDGIVNGAGKGAATLGRALRRTETGQLQLYGLVISIGVVAIALALYFFR